MAPVGRSQADRANSDAGFDDFLADAQQRLVRALLPLRGIEGAQDAASEGFAWALDNRARLVEVENPVGYLYRVALRRSASRQMPRLPLPSPVTMPHVEPQLVPALMRLPERQRAAVWLVHACGWSYGDVAEGLGIGTSTVGTHVTRALGSLRRSLTGSETVTEATRDDRSDSRTAIELNAMLELCPIRRRTTMNADDEVPVVATDTSIEAQLRRYADAVDPALRSCAGGARNEPCWQGDRTREGAIRRGTRRRRNLS